VHYIAAPRGVKATKGGERKILAKERGLIYIETNIPWRLTVELLGILGVFAVWFILNRWLLPKMGVST
jgi:hypothetical protein